MHTFIDIFGFDSLHAMCHITGGGLYDNLNRVIKNKEYEINVDFNNFCHRGVNTYKKKVI